MHRAMAIPRELQPSIVLVLLPTVIRLFSDAAQQASAGSAGYPGLATISERAMALFATLVADNQELQTAAMEADAIVKLAQIITGLAAAEATAEQGSKSAKQAKQHGVSWDMPRSPDAFAGLAVSAAAAVDRQREAVADVCGLKEECRKQVIDAKLLPHIVASLSHHSTGVRKAACRCTRSLSRSVKNLRTSLMDAGIAAPLFNLLFDTSIDVQIEASATLCNIVLDFSPMKKIVLEKGGVKRLVELVAQPNILLRRNALWALKNMTFQNDSEIKRDVMQHLGWDKLLVLMDDGDLVIQEQALNLLRNLACGKESANIFGVLERKLQTMAAHPEIVLQTLYIIVNLGIGNLEHKTAMMARTGLLQHTFAFLDHENPQIRVAAIWCVINLTWMDDPGARERVIALSALGIEEKLRRLVNDDNLDVKDRAATALSNMQGSLSAAGGSSSTAQPTSATGQTAPTVGDSSPAAQHDSSDTML
nr:Armadillo repeat-containing protein 8 [Polyrhizophydium stewartii]